TLSYLLFFLSHPLPSRFYTLSLHDALPISPVDGSAIAGETGTRSRGRSLANVRSRAPSDRALPASTRMSARRREARIGMSESDSDRKSTRLNSSHEWISYAVFCLKKKKTTE